MEPPKLDLTQRPPIPEGVDDAFALVLDEVRWKLPTLRIVCGMFNEGARLQILGCSRPVTMDDVATPALVGWPVRDLYGVLELGAVVVSRSIVDDPRLASLHTVAFGGDAVATAMLPLFSAGELAGFVRMDARDPAALDSVAFEALCDLASVALIALDLERERAKVAVQAKRIEALEYLLGDVRERDRQVEDAGSRTHRS